MIRFYLWNEVKSNTDTRADAGQISKPCYKKCQVLMYENLLAAFVKPGLLGFRVFYGSCRRLPRAERCTTY